MLAFLSDQRIHLEAMRNAFDTHYRTRSFNDPETGSYLDSILQVLNRLKDTAITREGTSENAMLYYFSFYGQKNSELKQIGDQFLNVLITVSEGITQLKAHWSNKDPISFNNLWREMDPKILWIVSSLQALENAARAHLKETDAILQSASAEPSLKKIERSDITPWPTEPGMTVMILQRNAKDVREEDSPEYGALYPASAEDIRNHARAFFDKILDDLPEAERASVDVMVIGSSAHLITPEGKTSEHKRAVETAEEVIAGAKQSLEMHSLPEKQILNTAGPIEIPELKDLLMFEQSPSFVRFLTQKRGTGKDFWMEYEVDAYRKIRATRGVEGPDQIADRVHHALLAQARFARGYHQSNPGRRLFIWIVSHYDAISPFIKKYVFGVDPATTYLPIDYGGGITLTIDKSGYLTCTIRDRRYSVL